MRILLIGAVRFSADVLHELIGLKANIVGVCTLECSTFNSDHVDLAPIAKNHGIPVSYTPDINSSDVLAWVTECKPDIIFCFGWSRIIGTRLLALPKLGILGFHPAALPANRGRHPLIWSLVLGLSQTASTFYFMDDGVDSGDILSQEFIEIRPEDSVEILYKRVTNSAIKQIHDFLPHLSNGTFRRIPQSSVNANIWRKRRELDGCIDWRMSAESIHNLVRAISKPYVGAHFVYMGNQYKVWNTKIELNVPPNLEPGKILKIDSCGILVKAGVGGIWLLDVRPDIIISEGQYL